MISIRANIDAMDHRDVLDNALDCYASTVDTVADSASVLDAENTVLFREKLAGLRALLTVDSSPADIRKSADEINAAIVAHHEYLHGLTGQSDASVREIMQVLADAAKSMGVKNTALGSQLWSFSRELESVSRLEDLSQIRSRIGHQVSQLRACADKMKADSMSTLAALKGQLKSFEARLEKVEAVSATDELTGLYSRGEAERRMQAFIAKGQPFSLVLLSLADCQSIAESYGRRAAEHVLRTFAGRLREQTGVGELAVRWGDDEFVAVLKTVAPETAPRAERIANACAGNFALAGPKGNVVLPLTCHHGFGESAPGLSTDQIFAQADKRLSDARTLLLKSDCGPAASTVLEPILHGPIAAVLDVVTGLPGRAEAEQAIAELSSPGDPAFVCLTCICDVAAVNARYGRKVTDQLLPLMTHNLRRACEGGKLFRWTGAALICVTRRSSSLEAVKADFIESAQVDLNELVETKRRNGVIDSALEVFPLTDAGPKALIQRIDGFLRVRKG